MLLCTGLHFPLLVLKRTVVPVLKQDKCLGSEEGQMSWLGKRANMLVVRNDIFLGFEEGQMYLF